MKKGVVISTTTSFVFSIAPTLIFTSVIIAAFIAPLSGYNNFISFNGDFILFAYLLALSRFFIIIMALDTGSAFSGMGASREGLFGALIEPGFFIIVSNIVSFKIDPTFKNVLSTMVFNNENINNEYLNLLIIILCGIGLFIILLTEGGRVPVDDSMTHLELTMIHEAMVLDNSGFDLAIINYATSIKMVIFSGIIANILIPFDKTTTLYYTIFFSVLLILPIIIGTIETFMARYRMRNVPQFLMLLTSVALVVLFCIQFVIL
jgi:formate hydrogenlyase subunit 4